MKRRDWVQLINLMIVLTTITVVVTKLGGMIGVPIDPWTIWMLAGVAILIRMQRRHTKE